jgi:phosphoserine phosphatase RsbU/P
VSGDFYDFIPLSDGRWGIVVADVSDKGMAAALFMASTRSVLRASANMGGSAVSIVEHANRSISQDAARGMFVTVFFAILDPQTHYFSYVNAGHNKPLWIRPRDGTIVELTGKNLALGIMESFPYSTEEIKLERGDAILFYTDGVTEATAGNNDLFGEEKLLALARECMTLGARQFVKTIDERVRAFTGAQPQSDDITVVALKRV